MAGKKSKLVLALEMVSAVWTVFWLIVYSTVRFTRKTQRRKMDKWKLKPAKRLSESDSGAECLPGFHRLSQGALTIYATVGLLKRLLPG
jgi:hypothetical protein